MGKGMKFLLCKPWHPMRPDNQEKKWIEEKKVDDFAKKEKERQSELAKERSYWDAKALAGLSTSQASKIKAQAPVAFLYQAPPTVMLQQEKEKKEREKKSSGEDITQTIYTEQIIVKPEPPPKNVPLRDKSKVKCNVCGHFANEKVCPKYDIVIIEDKKILDPLLIMQNYSGKQENLDTWNDDEEHVSTLQLKHRNTQYGATLSPQRGNINGDSDLLKFIPAEDEIETEDRERSFLASMTKDEKRAVFAQLLQEEKEKHKLMKRLKKEEKKEKKNDKHKDRRSRSREKKEKEILTKSMVADLNSRFEGMNEVQSSDVRRSRSKTTRDSKRREIISSSPPRRRRHDSRSISPKRRSDSPPRQKVDRHHHKSRSRSRSNDRRRYRSRSNDRYRR